MDNKKLTLEELGKNAGRVGTQNALVGLDGFVDKIVEPVHKRTGQGDAYEPIPLIDEFGKRISAAAGKSTNIELYPTMEKIGGNGPIMANALVSAGLNTRYIGALGQSSIHPVFQKFAEQTNAVSVSDPGVTHAVEFTDGKILLGVMASLDEITYDRILSVMGEGTFLDALNKADLIALVNWTMIPNMTSIFSALVEKVLPQMPPHDGRRFFFDLADPEKRSENDIQGVLNVISKFQNYGDVTLGLNLAEGQQIYKVLGFEAVGTEPNDLKLMASRIRDKISVHCVVIHPVSGAACADKSDSYYVEGPYCAKPKITTGAGDHFNAGFMTAQTIGLSPLAALTVAVCTSGSYVRSAKSPSLGDIESFIRNW